MNHSKVSKTSLQHLDSPHGTGIFEGKVTLEHKYTPNFRLASPQTSSLHPVRQQVWFQIINLDRENAGEERRAGNLWGVKEVGNWVIGLRPKQLQLPFLHHHLPPNFSTSPLFPLRGLTVTVGQGLLTGGLTDFGFRAKHAFKGVNKTS